MRALVLILAIGIMTAHSAKAENVLRDDVRQTLLQLVESGQVRAAVAGGWQGGTQQFETFGRASASGQQPPDANSVFEIGSISKVFTALLIESQVAHNRLSWDGSIAEYLPDAALSNSQVAAITLRELATHTSGLPRLPDNMPMSDPFDPYAGYDRDLLLAWLQGHDPDALDRSYAYSNLGAGLLGMIAGEAAGSDYARAMRTEVLEPLGMADTYSGLNPELQSRLVGGYSDGADMPNWAGFDALAGAGALFSTAADLMTFIEANLQPAATGELAASLQAIREPQGNGTTALGWHLAEAEGDTIWWHNGGTGGYASFLALRPAQQSGLVILTASTAYDDVTTLGMNQITGRVESAIENEVATAYAGAYQLAPGMILTVFSEDGKLFGQATGQGPFPLTPTASMHEFEFPAAQIRVVFKTDGAEAASELDFIQAGRTTIAPRVDDSLAATRHAVIEIDPAILHDYAGRYRLTPAVEVIIEVRGAQLFTQLTGQPAYPVFPYEKDRFFFKIVDAQIEFERNASGEVVALILHQMGRQRAEKMH